MIMESLEVYHVGASMAGGVGVEASKLSLSRRYLWRRGIEEAMSQWSSVNEKSRSRGVEDSRELQTAKPAEMSLVSRVNCARGIRVVLQF